jgi:hypothetical protein
MYENLNFLKDKTHSKLAQYYIMNAYMFDDSLTFIQSSRRWLRDVQYGGRLHILKQKAKSLFPTNTLNETIYFIIHVMHFFNFGQIQSYSGQSGEACCRYEKDANNFIKSQLTDRKCNCACFTSYVMSVAEEFGYTNLVKFCLETGHGSIVIIDDTKYQDFVLTSDLATQWNLTQSVLDLPNSTPFYNGDIIIKPLIVAKIESACDQVVINTIMKRDYFLQLYAPDNIENSYGITEVVRVESCENDFDEINNFTWLVREIVTQGKIETSFTLLFLVGEILNKQEWIIKFIKLCLCLIELKWVEIWIDQKISIPLEEAWEKYYSISPPDTFNHNMSLETATQFQSELIVQLDELRQDWYTLLPKENEKLMWICTLPYGLLAQCVPLE